MADVKWIKIVTDIFDDEKIQMIEALPESDTVIVLWFKLLCLAGKQNNSGVFMLNDKIPFTEEMLTSIFRRPLNVVRLALVTFEKFGMIEIINSVITIPNWEKHQNTEGIGKIREQNSTRQKAWRDKQKLIAEGKQVPLCDSNVTDNVTVTLRNALPLTLISNSISDNKPIKHKYGEYNNVLLTDIELDKLKAEYPDEWKQLIENLSEYIESKGISYKSHIATIRAWKRRDKENNDGRSGATGTGHEEPSRFAYLSEQF